MSKDFRYFRVDPEAESYVLAAPEGPNYVKESDCYKFCTVDTALTLERRSDYTVAATWAVTKDRDLLLLDLVRARLETPDITPLLVQVNARWSPGYIGIEGKSVWQAARRAGLPVRELKADRDKWTRAQPAAARMSAGTVYFRAGAPWLHGLEDELLAFPKWLLRRPSGLPSLRRSGGGRGAVGGATGCGRRFFDGSVKDGGSASLRTGDGSGH